MCSIAALEPKRAVVADKEYKEYKARQQSCDTGNHAHYTMYSAGTIFIFKIRLKTNWSEQSRPNALTGLTSVSSMVR